METLISEESARKAVILDFLKWLGAQGGGMCVAGLVHDRLLGTRPNVLRPLDERDHDELAEAFAISGRVADTVTTFTKEEKEWLL